MTTEQLKALNTKIDLIFMAILNMPSFIVAPHQKQFDKNWRKAAEDYKNILNQYEEIVKNENNSNTASVKDTVS